jgi:maltose O-acetyltransferase
MIAYLNDLKWRRYIKKLKALGLVIGEGTEILEPCFLDPAHCFLINIGSNCTIAPGVRFLAHDASSKKHIGVTKIGKINIGDKCFIGAGSIILPGVTIGSNSIIGAGSIVSKSIPKSSVATGNPARTIGTLEEYTEKLNRQIKSFPVFDEMYLIENITKQKKKEMLAILEENKHGFIV